MIGQRLEAGQAIQRDVTVRLLRADGTEISVTHTSLATTPGSSGMEVLHDVLRTLRITPLFSHHHELGPELIRLQGLDEATPYGYTIEVDVGHGPKGLRSSLQGTSASEIRSICVTEEEYDPSQARQKGDSE